MLGVLGILPAVLAVVAIVAAVVQTGVSIHQANEQQEAVEHQEKLQKDANKKSEVNQFKSQTAQDYRAQEQAAQIRMAAGSEAKINEFMTGRAQVKAARQLEMASKGDFNRAERYKGSPLKTLH